MEIPWFRCFSEIWWFVFGLVFACLGGGFGDLGFMGFVVLVVWVGSMVWCLDCYLGCYKTEFLLILGFWCRFLF